MIYINNEILVPTLLGTLSGGIITLILFNIQEKKKIRQRLRFEFYSKYEESYTDFSLNLKQLRSKIYKFCDTLNITGDDNADNSIRRQIDGIKSKSDVDISLLKEIRN